MYTLKLTALILPISMGWAVSAHICLWPYDGYGLSLNIGPAIGCRGAEPALLTTRKPKNHTTPVEPAQGRSCISDSTLALHEIANIPTGACRLDLDLIEIN